MLNSKCCAQGSIRGVVMFSIEDRHELEVLQKAISVARNSEDELLGSPALARVHTRVLDVLIEVAPDRAEAWRWWLRLETHPNRVSRIVELAGSSSLFPSWSREEQREHLATMLAPLTYTQSEFDEILRRCLDAGESD